MSISTTYTREIVGKNQEQLSQFEVGDLPTMSSWYGTIAREPKAAETTSSSSAYRWITGAYKEKILRQTFYFAMHYLKEDYPLETLQNRDWSSLEETRSGKLFCATLLGIENMESTYRSRNNERIANEIEAIKKQYRDEFTDYSKKLQDTSAQQASQRELQNDELFRLSDWKFVENLQSEPPTTNAHLQGRVSSSEIIRMVNENELYTKKIESERLTTPTPHIFEEVNIKRNDLGNRKVTNKSSTSSNQEWAPSPSSSTPYTRLSTSLELENSTHEKGYSSCFPFFCCLFKE